jgi:hypothetical protein
VSIGNPREFTQAEKQEQEVAEGCKRLIKNAITCVAMPFISGIYTRDPENCS